jgi:hypothetical protein
MIPSSKAKFLIGFFVSFIAFSSLSQNTPKHCGTDEMHQELFKTHPEYNAGILRAYERLQADTKAYEKQNLEKSDALYIIPIVFHVIHNYGVENINDDQILDAVKQLNIQFRKLNADTATVHADFQGMPSDAEIEFVLATKAPNGACFKGITRTMSPLSYQGDDGNAQVTAIRNGNDVLMEHGQETNT